ncbi:MAG: hypothetical protein FJ109_20515, partial [Deltaproteobacteria bacterium]|nr:hypothetical protein [Deltaproteobacteria bacterium]
MKARWLGWVAAAAVLVSCNSGDPPPFDRVWAESLSRVRTDTFRTDPGDAASVVQRSHLRDEYGRYVHFHGVNLSGSNK